MRRLRLPVWLACCFAWALVGCATGPPWFLGAPVPPSPVSAKANRAPSHIEADLRSCLLQQDQVCAVALLTELQQRRPLHADEAQWLGSLLWARANRYAAANQHRAAVRAYRGAQAFVDLPPVVPWHVQAGDEALGTGEIDEAQQHYKRAMQLQPAHPGLLLRAWLLSVTSAQSVPHFAQQAPSLVDIGHVLLAHPAHGFAEVAHAYLSLGGADPLVLQAALRIAAAADDEALEHSVRAVGGAADLGTFSRFANRVVACPDEALVRADVQANPETLAAAACAMQSGGMAWAERLVSRALSNAGDPAATLFGAALLWEAHGDQTRACNAWSRLAIQSRRRVLAPLKGRFDACSALFPQLRPGTSTAADLQRDGLPL